MADGIAFCVDAVEGLTAIGKRLLASAVQSPLPIMLIVTKLDRLILELKLPPNFAFTELRRVVKEVQTSLRHKQYPERISPELFNVVFTSARFSLCFTAESVGLVYNRNHTVKYEFDRSFHVSMATRKREGRSLGARLWGDYRYDASQKAVIASSLQALPHPFVLFVLEPLYKVFLHVLSSEPKQWSRLL
jgi:U5 small nuclear ribonucleoprotein component